MSWTLKLNHTDTWFLVGTAARVAVGMGLNICHLLCRCSSNIQTSLSFDLFNGSVGIPVAGVSLITADEKGFKRVVSLALGRPFALHDNDINVEVSLYDMTLYNGNKI